ncbi:glycosyltransferase [Mesorhizobium sp. LNHC209A00]|uniref:glycosyltransferase n=1 Tax=Mesorhizobium TaxID=68287 RepID=UPI0003CFFB7B|nr:glycosyltransferase [Mesorhizobium sp. LNHC209A00]ESY89472.1 hypothetical protein X738_31885 [Mesorhizobium sp. LNHC209A00]
MTAKPLISVLIPSYNHGHFIRAAVDSVFAQTHKNLQIVIVDDASTDGSADIIKALSDKRVARRILPENVGACTAMNIGLSMCEGAYIAVCNSDDIWAAPTKLEQQLEKFKNAQHVAAVFSDVEWIDDLGAPLSDANAPSFHEVFKQPNRSRFTWIRDLIEGGNRLCHPSALIRREVYEKVGLYNNFYRQLPDLDMWLRVLQHYEIFVMPEKLVKFRIHANNASRPSPTISNRSINEHRLILADMMRHITPENFYGAFGFTDVPPSTDPNRVKFEIARYLLDHRGLYERMFNQLGSEILLEIPEEETIRGGISAHKFHEKVGRDSPWIPRPEGPLVAETTTVDLFKTIVRRLKVGVPRRLSAIVRR